jgi:Mg2+-importing ATPase
VTQEYQAQRAADSLRKQVSPSAKVLRDGHPVDIPATEIVPGDVVLLAAGDLIPADARLIEARDLHVDEALLTGEAYPVEKETNLPSPQIAPASALPRNLVFMGSSVFPLPAEVMGALALVTIQLS